MSITSKKLIVVGDTCGKTSLLMVFRTGNFPEKYSPTVFESFITEIIIDEKKEELELWDTAGQEDYDRFKLLSCYPDSHAVLICFSISEPETLYNVREKWINKVLHYCPEHPILLIGCKRDLRNDPSVIDSLKAKNETTVTFEEGMNMARKLGAYRYIECSSKTGEGVYQVFENATRATLAERKSLKAMKATTQLSVKNHTVQYFPLSPKVLDRHDHMLWKKISELGKEMKREETYYDDLEFAAENVMPLDLRFAVLVEIGNLAARNGRCRAFEKATDCLSQIVNSLNPNEALIGLKNQMSSFCFLERGEYIPDYMECWNNRGSLEIFIRLASGIKGGDKSLRNETAILCRVLLQELKEIINKINK